MSATPPKSSEPIPIASGGRPPNLPDFISNKSIGKLVCGTADSPRRILQKLDCERIKTNAREREKAMGWFEWIATQNDSWRNPWVIDAIYRNCKNAPQELSFDAYESLRDKLNAYDGGNMDLPVSEVFKLRGTVNFIHANYDFGGPMLTAPSDYRSPAELEEMKRFGNNMGMAVMPSSIPGVLISRAMGKNETQVEAGGLLSSMAIGGLISRRAVKSGDLRIRPQRVSPSPREVRHGAPLEGGYLQIKPGLVVSSERRAALSRDPAHRGAASDKSRREADIGLDLEKQGRLKGPIVREPTGAAEFIDANGQKWDVKGFDSTPRPVKKGGFSVPTAMNKINKELIGGHNVIIDTKNMSQNHIGDLRKAVDGAGVSDNIIWY